MNAQQNRLISLIVLLLPLSSPLAYGDDAGSSSRGVLSKSLEEGKRMLVVGKIKAAYADRKDIMARFIRVRFDGETVQLAGFVQSEDAAKNAAGIAARTARSEKVQTYLQVEASVTNVETYPTHVGEQSEDALTKALVLTSLASPDVKPQFRNAEIQHVTVAHGQVTVYIIADAPPAEFNLSPHVTPIDGVKGLTVHVDKAYQPAPP